MYVCMYIYTYMYVYVCMCVCVYHIFFIHSVQFSSVAQSCPTLCDPMDCSMPGSLSITNSQSLLKLISIEWVMPFNHLILCHPLLPIFNPSQHQGLFQ